MAADHQSTSKYSLTYLGVHRQLEEMDRDIWEKEGRTDQLLRHLVYSPLLKSKEERVLLAEKFLTRAEDTELQLNIARYNLLLQVFVQCEHDFDPDNFSKRLTLKGIEPDVVTCNLLLMAYSQQGNLPGALAVLQTMRNSSFKLGEQVYASLITAYARAGQLEKSVKILALMEANGISPTNLSLKALLFACAEAGDEKKLLDGLQDAQKSGVFLDYALMRDLLYLLGSRDMTVAMASVLRHVRNVAFMRAYLEELLAKLIKDQLSEPSLLVYEHLLRMPPQEPPSTGERKDGLEHSADVVYLKAVQSTEDNLDKQRSMLLAAVQVAPAKSHLLTMLLRQQLDDPSLVDEAVGTFSFMAENRLPVFPHWLQEPLVTAAKEGNVLLAVKVFATIVNLGLPVAPSTYRLLMSTLIENRTPLKRFVAYLGCVRLTRELVEKLVSTAQSLQFKQDGDLRSGLQELLAAQQRMPPSTWKGQLVSQCFLREAVDAPAVCKNLARLSKERPLVECVASLEKILSTCELSNAVSVIMWALEAERRILQAVRGELFEDLLQLLHASRQSEDFLKLSRAMRDLGVPPPKHWKRMALDIHLAANNVQSAYVLYDLLIGNEEEISSDSPINHSAMLKALLGIGMYKEVVKSYEALLEANLSKNLRSDALTYAAYAYAMLHQLDAAKKIIDSAQGINSPRLISLIASGYFAEKRFEACTGLEKILKRVQNQSAATNSYRVVLEAYVELGKVADVKRLYSYMSARGMPAPSLSSFLAEALCNAGHPLQAVKHVKANPRGRTSWKVFASLLGHRSAKASQEAVMLLKMLSSMKSYGHLPDFLGFVLAGNTQAAMSCIRQPGFPLPVEELADIFIKPLIARNQHSTLETFFSVVQYHPSAGPLLCLTLEHLADNDQGDAAAALQKKFDRIPVGLGAKLTMGQDGSGATDAAAAGDQGRESTEKVALDSLDSHVVSLLMDSTA